MTSKYRGKLIVLYGINNVGKTTQAKKLVSYLRKNGHKAEWIKLADYKLKPTGPFLDSVLRSGKKQKISEEEFQLWFCLNRLQYLPKLIAKLKKGIIMVAEDYVGTGFVWGSVKGADERWLEEINKPMIKEDIAVLLDGDGFKEGIEKVHLHERNHIVRSKVRKKYLQYGRKFGWKTVKAEQSKEDVFRDILKFVKKVLR